ncbi:MAG: UPF0280 family protein [Desulfobacteraceae bacterium]|jgi:ApbE superfamily uncharacterized protein (UPF0280 family)
MNEEGHDRKYRQLVHGHLTPMRVTVQETDLGVYANNIEPAAVKEIVIEQRGLIEGYLHRHPGFGQSLAPLPEDPLAPPIIQEMLAAGSAAKVGPMAAVAGAVAASVGKNLLTFTDEVIIENGGDVFLSVHRDVTLGIYAGRSPLSLKVGIKLKSSIKPMAACTSSGTVGHSLSYGRADAVCVLSASCALADAAATAIGNCVKSPNDIEPAIQWGRSIPQVTGILAIMGDRMGMWGQIELTPLNSN